LVRRAVCGLTSKNYNRFFAQLVADLNASRSAFSAGDVRARLVAETADTQRWPTDDEFRQAWMTIEFYKRLKKSVQRMILEAVEAALHTGKTEKVKIEKKLTLEHFLPRDWEAHWPLVVREQSSDAHDLALQRRTQAIHRVGNLTLLTKELKSVCIERTLVEKAGQDSRTQCFELEPQPAIQRPFCLGRRLDRGTVQNPL
jgi:hypothetical protein